MAGVLWRRNIAAAGSGAQLATGLKVQTSSYGVGIPIVYGKARVAGNLIYYNDFEAIPHTTSQSAGKGGSAIVSTDYTYQAAIIMALCEGPIVSIGKVWYDQKSLGDSLFLGALFLGTASQAPWGYLTTNHPEHALPYQLTAYLANATWQLSSSATLYNFSFEILGFAIFDEVAEIYDANPADIITDFLTNANHGAGIDPAVLGSFAQFSDYCVAAGLFMSPVIDGQRQAMDWLRDLLQSSHSALVWSGGLFKILPYGDAAITGNGVTYTPDLTPLFDLTDDDYIVQGAEDPVRVKRAPAADAFNHVTVEFENREQSYNVETREAKDDAAIELYGVRPMPVLKMPWIKDGNVARLVAQLALQRAIYQRNRYQFALSWKHCLLEPMDLVTLSDTELGLDQQLVRITSIEEGEDDVLLIEAEEVLVGTGNAPAYASETGQGWDPDSEIDPGDTT